MRACTAGSFRMRLWPRPAVASSSACGRMLHEALGRCKRLALSSASLGHQRRYRYPQDRWQGGVELLHQQAPPAPRCDVAWPHGSAPKYRTRAQNMRVVAGASGAAISTSERASRLRDSANAAAPPSRMGDDRMRADALLGQTCAKHTPARGQTAANCWCCRCWRHVLAHPSRWAQSLHWPAAPPGPSSAWRDQPNRASAARAAAGHGHLPSHRNRRRHGNDKRRH